MRGRSVPGDEGVRRVGVYLFAFEKVVDVGVGQPEIRLVGLAGGVVEQIRRRGLEVEALGRIQILEQGAALAFGEARQRKHVCAAVAELREEPGDRFGGVVGADHEQPEVAGDRVLRDHAGTSLDVALAEVGDGDADSVGELGGDAIDAALDVEGDDALGLDESQRELRVVFVGLHPVGQTHRDERRVDALGPQPLDGELAESPRERRVLPPADAEHEPLRARRPEVVDEERRAALDLGGRVDGGQDGEGLDDAGLFFAHGYKATPSRSDAGTVLRMSSSRPVLFLVAVPEDADGDADAGCVQVDPEAPHLSVMDLGVTRGDGIFETISVCDGRAQALEPHLARLAHSAHLLDLPEPDLELYRRAVLAAIEAHDDVPELSVKTVMTRGVEGTGISTGWVYAAEAADSTRARTEGIRVVTLDRGLKHDVAQTSPWLLQGAKTLSYAVNRAALREAERREADDVIFTSSDGYVLEGPTSNVILRRGDTLATPRTDQGILAGTTQASVFDFAASIGMRTEYAVIPVAELASADALWLVSSVRQAAPINTLDGVERAVDAELSARLTAYLLGRRE